VDKECEVFSTGYGVVVDVAKGLVLVTLADGSVKSFPWKASAVKF
jgi:hypothetical protein